MDIVVVGAGVAGLVAAHLFRRDGHVVTIVERDRDASSTSGYRLHLDPVALEVLQDALPGNVFAALVASGTGGDAFAHLVALDEYGRAVLRLPRGDDSLMIGRRPLRRILLRGWEDNIMWGVRAARLSADGTRTIVLDDAGGVVAIGDLVVVADGTGSAIAKDVVGRPTARPAGVVGIAGRTPITTDTRPLFPEALLRGPGFVVGPQAATAFLAAHQPPPTGASDAVDTDLEEPYLLWSLILDGDTRPSSDLLPTALAATAWWSEPLRDLLRRSDPTSVDAFVFNRPVDLAGWPTGRVAVVGDAAHPIPPTAGIGASIAIADVGDLAAALRSTGDPAAAAASTQPAMLRRAAAAEQSSARVLRARAVLRHEWVRRPALRVVLPLADRMIRMRRRRDS